MEKSSCIVTICLGKVTYKHSIPYHWLILASGRGLKYTTVSRVTWNPPNDSPPKGRCLVQTFRNLILSGEFKEARGWHSEALRILDWNIFFVKSDIQPTVEKSQSPRKCKWNCQRQGAEDGGEDLFFHILAMDFEWFYDLFFLEQSFWRCCRYFHGCCRFSTICCPLLTISILTWQYLMYLFPTRWLCLDSHRQGRVNWLFSWVAIGSSHLECPRRLQGSSPNLI